MDKWADGLIWTNLRFTKPLSTKSSTTTWERRTRVATLRRRWKVLPGCSEDWKVIGNHSIPWNCLLWLFFYKVQIAGTKVSFNIYTRTLTRPEDWKVIGNQHQKIFLSLEIVQHLHLIPNKATQSSASTQFSSPRALLSSSMPALSSSTATTGQSLFLVSFFFNLSTYFVFYRYFVPHTSQSDWKTLFSL